MSLDFATMGISEADIPYPTPLPEHLENPMNWSSLHNLPMQNSPMNYMTQYAMPMNQNIGCISMSNQDGSSRYKPSEAMTFQSSNFNGMGNYSVWSHDSSAHDRNQPQPISNDSNHSHGSTSSCSYQDSPMASSSDSSQGSPPSPDVQSQEYMLQKMLQSQLASLTRLGMSGKRASWSWPCTVNSNYDMSLNSNSDHGSVESNGSPVMHPAAALASSILLSQLIPPEECRRRPKKAARTHATSSSRSLTQKDRPKRPLTAYNLFFKEERARLLAEQKGMLLSDEQYDHTSDGTKRKRRKTPHGKIGFEEMARIISKKWKEIDPSVLAEYEARAEAGKKRYREEIAQWLEGKNQA